MFCKNCLPSRGNPRVHWWFPWQSDILSALCITPAEATHNNLFPGSVDMNPWPFTDRSVWFSPAQHPAHAGHVHVWYMCGNVCVTETKVLRQQSLIPFYFVTVKQLLNFYGGIVVL